MPLLSFNVVLHSFYLNEGFLHLEHVVGQAIIQWLTGKPVNLPSVELRVMETFKQSVLVTIATSLLQTNIKLFIKIVCIINCCYYSCIFDCLNSGILYPATSLPSLC